MAPPALEQKIRKACLAVPGVDEHVAWGHPNFRVGGKTFAALERVKARPSLAVRVAELDAGLLAADERFFATPYGRGRWMSVWLDTRPPWALLRRLIEDAYREASAPPRRKRR